MHNCFTDSPIIQAPFLAFVPDGVCNILSALADPVNRGDRGYKSDGIQGITAGKDQGVF